MAKSWTYIKVNPNSKAKVDAEDFERLSKQTWRIVTKDSGRQKVVTNIITKDGRNRQLSLGQFLMNPPKGKMAYPRRFNDGFDYRKSNIVICTMQERQRIIPPSKKHGTSKFKGVSFISSRKMWRAALKNKGQYLTLGLYRSEEEAAAAYNKKAKELFGEKSYQNQIDVVKLRRAIDKTKSLKKKRA
jgi:hypothetical protein